MSVAIDLFGAVYTTQGGTRYHADRACYALANGRSTQAYRAGEGLYGEGLYGAQCLDGLYPLVRRSTISAQQFSYTACLVCVPPAEANRPLPFVTFTYGHEPVAGYLPDWLGEFTVCARCEARRSQTWLDPETDDVHVWRFESPVPWPCTSALVLGLAPRRDAS
jgi:hypothetical protein